MYPGTGTQVPASNANVDSVPPTFKLNIKKFTSSFLFCQPASHQVAPMVKFNENPASFQHMEIRQLLVIWARTLLPEYLAKVNCLLNQS